MARLRGSHLENDPKYEEVSKRLKKNADKAVLRGPYSVMDKKEVGPSGDKHDYLSLARYWWPNPDTSDGLPYVRRDGRTNDKALQQGDHVTMCNMCDDVETLALAGFYFNDSTYSRRAAELLRVWFLDPATRMNPNIKYGQAIPGRNDGRGSGIIDTRHFLRVIDSVALLRQSGAWVDEDNAALQAWMSQYLDWLLTSDAGQHEHAENNNHGTWYDVQTAAIALYVGKSDVVRDIVEHAKNYRVARCIEPDGTQPAELERTRSLHYCVFNLSALSVLARLGESVNVDLWSYQSADGRGIRRALDYVTPYLAGQQTWEHQQIDEVNTSPADLALYYLAATRYHQPDYMRLLKEDSRKPGNLEYTRLLFPADF
jgi:hypothetical protein